MRSFFVGGEHQRIEMAHTDGVALAMGSEQRKLQQAGDYQTGQMYVQGFLSGDPNGLPPLLMWHGGGMTGVTWETTPDERPGWTELALRDGFDVYVSDAVERGRSSVPPDAITGMDPVFRPKELAWKIFRMGPEDGYASDPDDRRPFEGQRFPVDRYDYFANQFVARWPDLTPRVEAAYAEYIQIFDKAVLFAHSQGCGFAQQAALNAPDRIAAVVLIEPSGSPDQVGMEALERLLHVPHLVVWGDFFADSPVWQDYRATVDAHVERLIAAGVPVTVIDLPAIGITGNSHFPMMDSNSAEIWSLVADWLRSANQ